MKGLMNPALWKAISKGSRYAGITLGQMIVNPDYLCYWVISSAIAVAYFKTTSYFAWVAIALWNLAIGVAAIASRVRFVDRAFLSLGLGHEKTGYGDPTWIVKGSRPFAASVIPIRSAGFAESDFEKYLPQISSRLCQPIESIKKPLASVPIIEITIKRSRLPSFLDYRMLDLDELRSGQFYIGRTDQKPLIATLADLPHMIVAGQTGSGKTTFIQQLMATLLARTFGAHAVLVDMKGGIDFQSFLGTPNFEIVSSHEGAKSAIEAISRLYEIRKAHLFSKKKENWTQLSHRDLASDPTMDGHPIGPVIFVVDELAELSKVAKAGNQGDELQAELASFARMCRYAGIHLILGTQRPEKRILDMQSKDNCPARVCFSVPSVAASTLVLRDMTATSLGSHPGRAVYQLGPNQIVQTPHLKGALLEERMTALKEKLALSKYSRRLLREVSKPIEPATAKGVEVPVT